MSIGNQLNSNFILNTVVGSPFDLDGIIVNLHSVTNKLEGLTDLSNALNSGCSSASFLGQLEKLFSGLRQCLLAEQTSIDIVLKANTVLLDIIPDIQHSDDLEIQFAQLIPIFIDNLGSPKAVVRKSTHKCIATYVKISKKLEYVMLHIVHSGLENTNSRARQHSMLVIPALLSLKPQVVERGVPEVVEMIARTLKKLKDPQEIVSKTAKKLIIELNKCYPNNFESTLLPQLKNEDERLLCRAVLRQDEDEVQRLLVLTSSGSNSLQNSQANVSSKRYQQEEVKQAPSIPNSQAIMGKNSQSYTKELSVVGKEILQSVGGSSIGSNQLGRARDLDKIIYEAKEESRYPKAQNGLIFGFLDENVIEALNENNQWKERTGAIENIESRLNTILLSDKKVDFLPHATPFLGFIIQFIPDINFKISLTTVKIIMTSLIEKLADSKIIIRQAVLKCCSHIIQNHKPAVFANYTKRYLQHGNWHVREGALSLLAHCILSQDLSSQSQEQEIQLASNPEFISELCSIYELEDKQKITQLLVDVLALALDLSSDKFKTNQLIQKQLNSTNMPVPSLSDFDTPAYSKDQLFYKQIQERLARGNLPYINEEGLVEFPQTFASKMQANQNQLQPALSQTNIDKEQKVLESQTLAQVQKNTPSMNFLEGKRREEEKKAQTHIGQHQQTYSFSSKHDQMLKNSQQQQIPQQQIVNFQQPPKDSDKISMWLPSFPEKNMENTRESQPSSLFKNDEKSQFNNTSSSVATYLEDGRTTNTTMLSSNKKPNQPPQLKQSMQHSSSIKSPAYTEAEKLLNESSQALNQLGMQQQQFNSNQRLGYTPEQHSSKPRSIQSNEQKRQRNQVTVQPNLSSGPEKQKDIDNPFSIGLPQHSNFNKQNKVGQDISYRNHSQSSVPDPSNIGAPQVTDRLQLLKTKYNPKPVEDEDAELDKSPESEQNTFSQVGPFPKPVTKQMSVPTQKIGGHGPIRPVIPTQDFMQMGTINNDDDDHYSVSSNLTPQIRQTSKKPPITQKSTSANMNKSLAGRAQSVDGTGTGPEGGQGGDNYHAVAEPLPNPDLQFKQCYDQLQSGDWAKQFEACNNLKRVAMFHKHLLSSQNPMQLPIIKELVKLVDSLRSQLAKNAILTLIAMYENLSNKDMDPSVDQILPSLLKKAADTNVFIAETADKALASVCTYSSEHKVFASLQAQNAKSNPMKVKLALCYNILIEKLGTKIRQFTGMEKLIQSVCTLLNEGALEVRNMAKVGILQIKAALGSQRELEGLLMRLISNEKQYERIKGILDKGDYDSVSQTGSTRYGTSMRGSSLDSRSAGPYRGIGNHVSASGSDGFGQFSHTEFTLQSQYKGPQHHTAKTGFGSTSNGFKKSVQAVSKPVDPQLMEEFRQIINELQTNDWNKRLKAIDTMTDWIQNNQSTIKTTQSSKFISLIDTYAKILQDNNAKVLSSAQQSFKIILKNPNLKHLIEQSLALILSAICSNLASTNIQVKDQGEQLFNTLEEVTEFNLLLSPMIAQINLSNQKAKVILLERLTYMLERNGRTAAVQKQIQPLLQPHHKIQVEATSNPKLKEALNRLAMIYQ